MFKVTIGVGYQLLEDAQFGKSPRIFGEVAELARHIVVNIAQKPKTKRVFAHFVKGLGLFCNEFWGYGYLGPHECNLSNLSHTIKKEWMVKGKITYGLVLY